MPDQKFNEAEQYLLERWEIAAEVEESMELVRNKYQTVCEQIAEQMMDNHKELDKHRVEVKRSTGTFKDGGLVLGRGSWPSDGNNPTGFWAWNLGLDWLADPEEHEPIVGFWLCWEEKAEEEFYGKAEKAIGDAMKKRLTSEQLKIWKFGDNWDEPLIGRQIAPKQELLSMLSKGESERFINTIVEQLQELAIFIPEIDLILEKKPKVSS